MKSVDRSKIIDALKSKIEGNPCYQCDEMHFKITTDARLHIGNELIIPCIVYVCQRCGHINLFSTEKLLDE